MYFHSAVVWIQDIFCSEANKEWAIELIFSLYCVQICTSQLLGFLILSYILFHYMWGYMVSWYSEFWAQNVIKHSCNLSFFFLYWQFTYFYLKSIMANIHVSVCKFLRVYFLWRKEVGSNNYRISQQQLTPFMSILMSSEGSLQDEFQHFLSTSYSKYK